MTLEPYQWMNHKLCASEAEAEAFADTLIGGGVIQEQEDGWHCFGFFELQRKIADENP